MVYCPKPSDTYIERDLLIVYILTMSMPQAPIVSTKFVPAPDTGVPSTVSAQVQDVPTPTLPQLSMVQGNVSESYQEPLKEKEDDPYGIQNYQRVVDRETDIKVLLYVGPKDANDRVMEHIIRIFKDIYPKKEDQSLLEMCESAPDSIALRCNPWYVLVHQILQDKFPGSGSNFISVVNIKASERYGVTIACDPNHGERLIRYKIPSEIAKASSPIKYFKKIFLIKVVDIKEQNEFFAHAILTKQKKKSDKYKDTAFLNVFFDRKNVWIKMDHDIIDFIGAQEGRRLVDKKTGREISIYCYPSQKVFVPACSNYDVDFKYYTLEKLLDIRKLFYKTIPGTD